MDEVVIKEEPLDWDFFDGGSTVCNFGNELQQEIRDRAVEETNNIMADRLRCAKSGKMEFKEALVSKSSEKIITVNVAESVKTEDEISFIKQVTDEENRMHDPALIMPTDLEIYVGGMKSGKMQKTIEAQHKCRKQCNKMFRTLTERAFHEMNEHKNTKRSIKCNFCNETLDNFFALTRHMAEHRDEQRYVCSHCSKNFQSFIELQMHWKTSDTCNDGEKKDKNERSKTKQSIEKNQRKPSNIVLLSDIPQQKPSVKLSPNLPSNLVNAAKPQPLSFAEEVKAFTAKYQLKTVAKKRTSAFTLKPVQKGKKGKHIDYDFESTYAVPMGINNGTCHLQDVKIKEEPMDDEEMATTVNADVFDPIQIKNEPHDDYEDFISKNFITETTKSSNCDGTVIPDSLDAEKEDVHQNHLDEEIYPVKLSTTMNSPVLVKSENDINDKVVSSSLASIISSDQKQSQLHPKILLSKANFMSMKNVKILKLGPQSKIVKLSPPSAQAGISKIGLSEDKTQQYPEKKASANADIDATPVLSPEQIKTEQTLKNIKQEFAQYQESTYDKDNMVTIDMEEMIKNSSSRRSLPKWLIRYMEEQPQKRKIIDDLQRQFCHANEIMKQTTSSTIPISDESLMENAILSSSATNEDEIQTEVRTESTSPLPESFFVKVTDNIDKELMIARRQYQDHYYAWICPMCYKQYTHKHTFNNHLIGTHKLCAEKLKAITVEVKPFLFANVKPEQNISSIKKSKKSKTVDVSVLRSRFECSKCMRTYWTKQAFIDHENSDCGRLPLHVCKLCAKPFASRSTLNCHMSIHTGALPYKCNYCEKRFRTNGQVRVHHRKHTGEKPFTCQICAFSFTHRETLISHLARHMDIKRYICKGCNKRFSTISALTTHRNVRPTTCGALELDTQAVGPLIRVTNGQISFEPQPFNGVRTRRKICQEILTEIQNIPKNEEPEQQEEEEQSSGSNPLDVE